MNAGIKAALVLVAVTAPASGQEFLEQFSYDGLGFSGIGFQVGAVGSDRLTTELTGAVKVDVGLFAPSVRLLFGASYFKGNFKQSEIDEFEDAIRRVLDDPSAEVDVGTISWSNFELDLSLQYLFALRSRVTPFAGLGFAAHVRNGSGEVINGTFVEDALDGVVAALNGSVGAQIQVVSSLDLLLEIRGGLTSELRTLSGLAGVMYRVP